MKTGVSLSWQTCRCRIPAARAGRRVWGSAVHVLNEVLTWEPAP
ncbi:MAG: hypothetical protein WCF33_22530 [Pseudonocardiaceae bacterium]